MVNDFQYRLQKSISEKGISASELSRISGVGKSDISNYINGVYVAKQDKCFMLADALGVDPGWLMTGEEPKKDSYMAIDPESEGYKIAVAYNHAEAWQKEAVKKLLNIT